MAAMIEAHQDALIRGPGLLDAVFGHVLLELGLRFVGGPAQRELPQRRQVSFAEEVVKGSANARGWIDIAVLHALAESGWRNIDQFHLVGLVQDPVRQGFAHPHPGDARHQVV